MNTLDSNLLKKIFHCAGPYCFQMSATSKSNKKILEESEFNKYRFLGLTNRFFNILFEKENSSLKAHNLFQISLKENDEAFCTIAKAYAAWDLVKAFGLAEMISDQEVRMKAFTGIKKELEKLACSNPDKALLYVDCLEDHASKQEMLILIAKFLAVKNLEKAMSLAEYEIVTQEPIFSAIANVLSAFDPCNALKVLQLVAFEFNINALLSIINGFTKINPLLALKSVNEMLLHILKNSTKEKTFRLFIQVIEIYAILEFTTQYPLPNDLNTLTVIDEALDQASKNENKLEFIKELALTLCPWPELALEVAKHICVAETQVFVFLAIADSLKKLSKRGSAAYLATRANELLEHFKDNNLRNQYSLLLGQYHFELAINTIECSNEKTLILANLLMKSGDELNLKKLIEFTTKQIDKVPETENIFLLSMAQAAAQAKIKPEDNLHLIRLLKIWSDVDNLKDDFNKGIVLIQRAHQIRLVAPQKAKEFADRGLEHIYKNEADFEMNIKIIMQAQALAEIDISKAKDLGDRGLTGMLETLPKKFQLDSALKALSGSIHVLDFKKVEIFLEKTIQNYQQLGVLAQISLNALNL